MKRVTSKRSTENSEKESKQLSLGSFFLTGVKKGPVTVSSAASTSVAIVSTSTPASPSRKLLASTVEKWKGATLAKFSAAEWLLLNTQTQTGAGGLRRCFDELQGAQKV